MYLEILSSTELVRKLSTWIPCLKHLIHIRTEMVSSTKVIKSHLSLRNYFIIFAQV